MTPPSQPGGAAAPRGAAATSAPAVGLTSTQPVGEGVAEPAILEPSQGRPIILRPGDRFYFLMRIGPDFDGDVYVTLLHSLVKELYFPISLADRLVVEPGRHASMVLQIPSDVPEGLYDLRVRGASKTLEAPHSVKVVAAFKPRFRFVHLSDMHVGDPVAPDFDRRLPDEINLLAPEFILATGDYLDALVDRGDGARAWNAILHYFRRFHAPVYLLCGEHDDVGAFAPRVAASPVGSFDYGAYHGVLLLNNPASPVDDGQVEFVRRDLAERRESFFNFIASNDDDPRVLDRFAGGEAAVDFVRRSNVRLLLCGGTSDWDGREYAAILAQTPGLHYVRTHAASTTRRGRATGVSHYRVFEVDGQEFSYVYPADASGTEGQPSVPAGSIEVTVVGDGPSPPAVATAIVRNGLNQPFADGRLWIVLRKNGDVQPKVAGGRLVQVLDGRTYWLCEIAVDVPDRGGLRVMASVAGDPPAVSPVEVVVGGDEELPFTVAMTDTDLSYAESSGRLVVTLRNASERPQRVRPVARLLGQTLALASSAPSPIELAPGQSIDLPYRLLLPEVIEGLHYVQVSFADDPLQRLHMRAVLLRRAAP